MTAADRRAAATLSRSDDVLGLASSLARALSAAVTVSVWQEAVDWDVKLERLDTRLATRAYDRDVCGGVGSGRDRESQNHSISNALAVTLRASCWHARA